MLLQNDFLTKYLNYTSNTESHKVYHRWSAITTIGALLGRNRYIPFGHGKIHANFYCMLLGEPGARKSSAIKLAKRLSSLAGYENFSSDRSSREKFLLDLGGDTDEEFEGSKRFAKKVRTGIDITSESLWGTSGSSSKEIREVYIVADEFNEFVSAGNVDFYTTLGNLWDWDNEDAPYEDRVKNTKSVSIYQPTVSLLGGNTQENFARAFPPEILGHGFLSRLLLIHGIPSGRKIAFPVPPTIEDTAAITGGFSAILKGSRRGIPGLTVAVSTRKLLEEIYTDHPEIDDPRFKGYNTRRYTHLLKLCIITAASLSKQEIDEDVVVYANTMLSAIEHTMPISIGEFGKSKNSDVAHRILMFLNAAQAPVNAKQLWTVVHKDLGKMSELSDLLHNLQAAEKVQHVIAAGGKSGWLPKKEVAKVVRNVDWNLLSEEERNLL